VKYPKAELGGGLAASEEAGARRHHHHRAHPHCSHTTEVHAHAAIRKCPFGPKILYEKTQTVTPL
jgi:hypothetical protein